jgi:DNA-binding transcriptional ArsR family regulator
MYNIILVNPAQPPKQPRRRAKTGKGRLHEAEAHEGSENQPRRVDGIGEDSAQQHHAAGKKTNEGINFHEANDLYAHTIIYLINVKSWPINLAMPKSIRRISDEGLVMIARRFAILSEPMRLRLLHALVGGEQNVNALADITEGTQANVSRHLQTLAEAGLISRRKEGLQVFYAIADDSIFQLCNLVCGSLESQHKQRAGWLR